MISLTSRQKDILIYLINQRQYITINQLSKKFKISSRSIRNDLDIIDDFLAIEKIKIIRQPNKGIKLYIDELQLLTLRQLLSQIKYRFLDIEERTKLIALLLLCQETVTFDQLAEICELSRQTVINSFLEVENLLIDLNIKVVKNQGIGLVIASDEISIRKGFAVLINNIIDNELIIRMLKEKTALSLYHTKAHEFLSDIEQHLSIRFIDNEVLSLNICYFLMRLAKGAGLDDQMIYPELSVLYGDNENSELVQILKTYDYSKNEQLYLCRLILNVKRQELIDKDMTYKDKQNDAAYLISEYLLAKLQELQPVDVDTTDAFVRGLSQHLRVAIYRIKNNIAIKNELLDQIKLSIPLIYEFTKKQLTKCEKDFDLRFDENEIAYIAMYIASAYENSIKIETVIHIMLVCSFGLATSSILKTRIDQTLPDCNVMGPFSKQEAEEYVKEHEIDLVITTHDCYLENIPSISVNPLLSQDDIDFIKNKLFQLSYSKICDHFIKAYANTERHNLCYISDYLTKSDIQILEECNNWEEAIQLAATPLLRKHMINQEYINRMIDAVKQYGPYMVLTPKTAFIHAGTEDGINENCASILVLKKPILFGSKHQRLVSNIVVLGIKDKNENSLLKLVYIFENKDNLERLASENINIDSIYEMHD